MHQVLSDLQPSHVEDQLQRGEDGCVDGRLRLHTFHVQFWLTANKTECKVAICGDGNDLQYTWLQYAQRLQYLRIHERYRNPVVHEEHGKSVSVPHQFFHHHLKLDCVDDFVLVQLTEEILNPDYGDKPEFLIIFEK